MNNIETMKLALEALEFIPKSGSMLGAQAEAKRIQAIAALQEELSVQQLNKPCLCGKQTVAWCMANTCNKALRQAINAAEHREQAQQAEPVAWCIIENGRAHGLVKTKPAVMNAEKWQPLYTAPPHITDGSPCWCNPETNFVDSNTGAAVVVHKEPQ